MSSDAKRRKNLLQLAHKIKFGIGYGRMIISLRYKSFCTCERFQTFTVFLSRMRLGNYWLHDKLVELELAGFRFFLQDYYNKRWANNFMFYINVEDAQAGYEHILKVLEQGRFGKAKVSEPKLQSHGDIVTRAWAPSGVLLHLAQRTK